MKKLLLILITAVVGLAAHAADITIYYDNSNTKWSQVIIHPCAGTPSNDITMDKVTGNIYKATFPTTITKILFQQTSNTWGNAVQTVDYGIDSSKDGHLFYGQKVDGDKCSVTDNGLYSGGVDPGPTPDPDPTPDVDGYYVYFVNNNNWGSVNIWAWNGSDNNLTNATGWPGDEMELVSGNTYIWRLPAGKGVPTNVKFSNGGANATDNLVFKNHATYYPDGSIVEEIVRGANILYCHFKTDRVRRTNGNESAIPRCHVFGNDDAHFTEWGTDEEKMTKIDDPTDENGKDQGGITARYELWKYEIPVKEFQSGKYNNAVFYVAIDDAFSDDNKTNKWQTNKGWGENRNNYLKENWTKYIYSTFSCNQDGKDVNYAVPTYVTPSEFLTLHQKKVVEKGRDGIFIVGPSNNFKYKDAATGNWLQFNNYDPISNRRLTPDDGVFYLEVQPNENSYDKYKDNNPNNEVTGCEGNKFKLSWMDVVGQKNTAETREGGASSVHDKLAADRNWATFDLGSIGIDTKLVPSGDYAANAGPAGRVKFQLNKPYRYTNNNTCDWFICEQTTQSRWIILDTHYDSKDANYQCEIVTITDFDPHPTLTAEFKEFHNDGELPSGAPAHPNLYAENANGHVDLLCNYANAQATITASTNTDKFTRNYEVEFNGEKVADVPGNVTSFRYDYFPVDISNEALKLRARYENESNGTTYRFHSRTGDTNVTGLTYESTAPEEIELTGTYIENYLDYQYKKDADGNDLIVDGIKVLDYCNRKFGVFVSNFNINIDSRHNWFEFGTNKGELAAYADYRVFDENGKEITDKCKLYVEGVGNDLMKQRLVDNKLSNTPWNHNDHWAKSLKEETVQAPLYIETIHDGYVKDVKDLDTRTYTIVLQAVYPLVYQKNFAPVASTSAVNGELIPVAKTAATPLYDTKHVRKATTVTVKVSPQNTVTGVDEVFGDAEADNADAPAEYYTISGVRVNGDLAPGIYVVRRGNKVTKEVVK